MRFIKGDELSVIDSQLLRQARRNDEASPKMKKEIASPRKADRNDVIIKHIVNVKQQNIDNNS